ncbi:Lactosylceramide 1-3-N-acetyl-beta-D-glucosaminyltransferase-like [Homarus americanus]|uniref:Hexosyltransferase n=2 Tax=Homarus americanus TaxID=6706 RepID=A0A8J5JQ16_HOMAM|nr:Lactosylceramide 1-3-N-acetyl-beta-D-glucosaminyltransferase-like [Homarus americanus]
MMVRQIVWCQPGRLMVVLSMVVGVMFLVGMWQNLLTAHTVNTPSPLSVNPLYPSRIPLMDLPDFTYIINNDVCGKEDVFITVIIHTHPANSIERDIMRQNVPSEHLRDLGMRRVFLLARAEWQDQKLYQKTPQWSINKENMEYHDIIQGNFKEHYHNLTYKHIMGLQWATNYCPQTKYIIKMDDDIAVDLYQFRDRLKYRFEDRENLILGLLQVEAKPVRKKESKWYVSLEDYPEKYYAPFMSGWAYAMTVDAARAIVEESHRWPYFWIDDVHVTGTLAEKVGVKREGLNRFYTLHVDHLHCCVELPNSADYYCDFLAGPSEGDPDVLVKVLSHARSCYVDPCQRRPPEASVTKTCVRAKIPPLAPLGKGHGEIVKIT